MGIEMGIQEFGRGKLILPHERDANLEKLEGLKSEQDFVRPAA